MGSMRVKYIESVWNHLHVYLHLWIFVAAIVGTLLPPNKLTNEDRIEHEGLETIDDLETALTASSAASTGSSSSEMDGSDLLPRLSLYRVSTALLCFSTVPVPLASTHLHKTSQNRACLVLWWRTRPEHTATFHWG